MMTLDIDLIQFSKTEYIAMGDGAKLRPGYLRRKQAAPSQMKQRRVFAEILFRTCFSGRYNPRMRSFRGPMLCCPAIISAVRLKTRTTKNTGDDRIRTGGH